MSTNTVGSNPFTISSRTVGSNTIRFYTVGSNPMTIGSNTVRFYTVRFYTVRTVFNTIGFYTMTIGINRLECLHFFFYFSTPGFFSLFEKVFLKEKRAC